MGLSALPASSRVYLDANVWIYALEGYAAYAVALKTLFARIDTGEITAITSALTLAEVLVKPFADGNTALQRLYSETLQDVDLPPIKHVPLQHPPIALVLNDAPVTVLFAVLLASRGAQKHDGHSLSTESLS
ncbi:MAG: hypothetical protein M3436_04215 [Pseudomonadota bacterium]|nr:hypothetical protein [Pseudomonadota bacterium]